MSTKQYTNVTVMPSAKDGERWTNEAIRFFAEHEANYLKQKMFLREIAGISSHDLRVSNRFDMLLAQGEKIQSLKTQMAQMNNGYNNKINRLQQKIEVLETALNASGQNSIDKPSDLVEILAKTVREVMNAECRPGGRLNNVR